MKSTSRCLALLLLAASAPTLAAEAAASRLHEITDPDTRAWWQATEALSNDAMEGRDIGSAGYDRAAQQVARRFAAAGLKPAGEDGTWFQPIRFDDWLITKEGTHIAVGDHPLRLLHDILPRPSPGMPTTLDAPVMFGGYCAPGTLGNARGKMVLCYGWNRAGLTSRGDRLKAVEQAGAVGILDIARSGFHRGADALADGLRANGRASRCAGTGGRSSAGGLAQCGCAGAGHRRLRP